MAGERKRKEKPEATRHELALPVKRTALGYDEVLGSVVRLIEDARRAAARSVNALLTATYWQVGRRIVEQEQRGATRAEYYGEELIERLSMDLSTRFGRGFGRRNLFQMRAFYLAYPELPRTSSKIVQTPSALSSQAPADLAARFPLPWSHYVRLLSVDDLNARQFYETEALRGGWTIRQLERQVGSQFYERTALSRNKLAMLTKGDRKKPGDAVTPEEEIKDPFVLEFLGLKDEYSESQIEEALIQHLERFLLELGGDFAFIGRQRRLRVGDAWYRVDLVFFHRKLRCLVIVDLKPGKFTHADAGQMHLYLNYARHHWMNPGENPPVGLILCAEKNAAVARYALEGLPNVLAAKYKTALPEADRIAAEMERIHLELAARICLRPQEKRGSRGH